MWRDTLAAAARCPTIRRPAPSTQSDFDYWRDHFGETVLPAGLLTGKVLYSPLVSLGAGSGQA